MSGMGGTMARDVFVGRARELEELRRRTEEALTGRGGLWLLVGDPGIGKTRLAAEVAAFAEERGAKALWGKAWQGSGAPAYWPLIQVVRHLVQGAARDTLREDAGQGIAYLLYLLPELADALGEASSPAATLDPDAARFALLDSTAAFLRNRARRRPLVLVFDDLHWADPATVEALEFLGSMLDQAAILVIGSYREVDSGMEPDHAQRLGELARFGGHLPLTGLSVDEVARLIREGFDESPSEQALRSICSATGGNPFFVHEVARMLIAEERLHDLSGYRLGPTEGVRAVIRRRLEPLPEDARHALRAAAVAGRVFAVPVLAAALQRAVHDVVADLSYAVAVRLLYADAGTATYSFNHDLIREVLAREISSQDRASLHLRLGEALERAAGERTEDRAAELAHHFLAALPEGDIDRAVQYARIAGDRAAAGFAYRDAADHYESALRLVEEERLHEACDLLIEAGEARHRAGQRDRARAHCQRAAAIARTLRDAERLARAALTLGRFGFAGARVMSGFVDDEVISLLEEALDALPPGDSNLKASVLARLATALYWAEDDPTRRDATSREAIDMAARLGDERTLVYALLNRYWAVWGPDNAEERLDIATRIVSIGKELGDEEFVLQGRHLRLTSLLELSRAEEIDREIEAQARVAERLHQPAYPLHTETLLRLMRGRPAEVLEHAKATTAVWAQVLGPYWADQWMGVQVFNTTWNLGRPQDLVPVCRGLVERFPTVEVWKAALALVLSEAGEVAAARDVMDRLAADDFTSLRRDWNFIVHMAMTSWACSRLGDTRRAASLYEILLPYADRCATVTDAGAWVGPMAHYLGMLAATLKRSDAARAHFEDAIDTCLRFGARPWLARSEAALAKTLLAGGSEDDRRRAHEMAERARAAATELGMPGVAEEAEAVLAQTGATTTLENHSSEDRVFRREGQFWTIAYGGKVSRIRDSKGLRYLNCLLQHPGREFHALQLAALVEGGGARGQASRTDETPTDGMAAEPIFDEEAKRSFRNRIEELRGFIEDAEAFDDRERAAHYREELERISEELAKAVGLHGRDRRAAIASERARINVTRVLRRAIEVIKGADPGLGTHLDDAVRTGTYLSYAPTQADPNPWRG